MVIASKPICTLQSKCFLRWPFVEHTASFIGQTLNLKAWWGVYWSPDPVLHSLNWFMDSISGAQAAGVHVGVRTRLTGIHHTDQVSSAASSLNTLTRPLQMLLAYSPAWPKAKPYAGTCTCTYSERLDDVQRCKKTCTQEQAQTSSHAQSFCFITLTVCHSGQTPNEVKLCSGETDHSCSTGQ